MISLSIFFLQFISFSSPTGIKVGLGMGKTKLALNAALPNLELGKDSGKSGVGSERDVMF